jgi:hypothetical protein
VDDLHHAGLSSYIFPRSMFKDGLNPMNLLLVGIRVVPAGCDARRIGPSLIPLWILPVTSCRSSSRA